MNKIFEFIEKVNNMYIISPEMIISQNRKIARQKDYNIVVNALILRFKRLVGIG